MKLKIERSAGECWESFDMESDYEEVLALVTELGFCKDIDSNKQNVVINCGVGKQYSQEQLDSYRC